MPWTPATPEHSPPPGLDLATRQSPCRGSARCGDALAVETGRADNLVQFLLLDVAGHGEAAAPTADFILDLLRDPALRDLSPDRLLTTLHARIQPHWLEAERHVEAVALLVDAGRGALIASRAGALPALRLWRQSGAWEAWEVPCSTFLGFPHEVPYPTGTQGLAGGESALAFTDGVAEAGRSHGDQFQHGALHAFLGGLRRPLAPSELLRRLWSALEDHSPADWDGDDVTAFALCRRGGENA